MWMRFLFHFFFKGVLLLALFIGVGIGIYHHFSKDARHSREPIVALSTSQLDFIHFILGQAEISNEAISNQRKHLLELHDNFTHHKRIPLRQRHWLERLALTYKERDPDFKQKDTWHNLIKKVDVVPNGLVLAQAIEESGWGQSRFAQQGNNFFGLACYGQGCGLAAHASAHQVQMFETPLQSVSEYMLNLNSLLVYKEFREMRAKARRENEPLSSLLLADTLSNYSTHPEVYMDKLKAIIRKYHLVFYDEAG